MDHLPKPKNASNVSNDPPVPVLKFAGTPCRYESSPFSSFPARNGYDNAILVFDTTAYANNGTKTKEEAEAFVQEWLWFGLLSEFLERDIDLQQFVCKGSHCVDDQVDLMLTTQSLPYILTEWCRETDRMDPGQRTDRLTRIENLLGAAAKFVYAGICYYRGKTYIVRSEISLSIQMLGCTLTKVLQLMQASRKAPTPHRSDFFWGLSTWTVERLLQLGWCPSTIPILTSWFPRSHYFLPLLGPYKSFKDHTQGCTEVMCKHDQVDPSNYPIKHTKAHCTCGLLSIPSIELAQAIDNNSLPLIRISQGRLPSISLILGNYDSLDSYV